jgi:hypothetical protein
MGNNGAEDVGSIDVHCHTCTFMPTINVVANATQLILPFLFFGTLADQCSKNVPATLTPMKATKKPRLRHLSSYRTPIESRNTFVEPNGHMPHVPSTFISTIVAPVYSRYAPRYDSQVKFLGTAMRKTSISEHVTALFAMPALILAEERDVTGETLYMKIQKRGRSVALMRTLERAD